ncbi:MAG: sigma-70 family RNA polymerase sigma factor [Pirellulales bacterium]|nr:sigma-70 family RNA polymerase sigma factor [Pirellulales bacterium]
MQRHEEFVGLLVKHQQSLFSYIRTLVPQHADAEDLLQQVSLVLWRKFDDFEPGSEFLAWSCRVAYFEVLNFRRRQPSGEVAFSADFVEHLASAWAERSDQLADERTALEHCVEQLSPADRHLVTLCYDGQHATKEVAEQLGRSPDSVYVSLHRIRRWLGDCIRRVLSREESA